MVERKRTFTSTHPMVIHNFVTLWFIQGTQNSEHQILYTQGGILSKVSCENIIGTSKSSDAGES